VGLLYGQERLVTCADSMAWIGFVLDIYVALSNKAVGVGPITCGCDDDEIGI